MRNPFLRFASICVNNFSISWAFRSIHCLFLEHKKARTTLINEWTLCFELTLINKIRQLPWGVEQGFFHHVTVDFSKALVCLGYRHLLGPKELQMKLNVCVCFQNVVFSITSKNIHGMKDEPSSFHPVGIAGISSLSFVRSLLLIPLPKKMSLIFSRSEAVPRLSSSKLSCQPRLSRRKVMQMISIVQPFVTHSELNLTVTHSNALSHGWTPSVYTNYQFFWGQDLNTRTILTDLMETIFGLRWLWFSGESSWQKENPILLNYLRSLQLQGAPHEMLKTNSVLDELCEMVRRDKMGGTAIYGRHG